MRVRPMHVVYVLTGALLLTWGAMGYGVYKFRQLASAQRELITAFLSGQKTSDARFMTLEEKLGIAVSENVALSESLKAQDEKSQELEARLENQDENIHDISGSVGTLEKLSKTDPELLAKYSKVFFLSEHYAPARLVLIDKQYLYSEDRNERFDERAWPYLKRLLTAAGNDRTTIYIKSAYRSFEEQRNTKSSFSVTYGAGTANTFSADQGYSEHQLGTTVDFITTGLGGQLEGFDGTQAYTWLQQNAYKYGFVLSYPEGNQYYIFEPWHWRFVGIKLATDLHKKGHYFYDLDQRDIDEYLVTIFD